MEVYGYNYLLQRFLLIYLGRDGHPEFSRPTDGAFPQPICELSASGDGSLVGCHRRDGTAGQQTWCLACFNDQSTTPDRSVIVP
jgi:hypothetical protein